MLLLQSMVWLSENYATAQPEVAKRMAELPLVLLWGLVGSFLLGVAIQDIYNRDSWLRINFRSYFGGVEIGALGTTTYANGGRSFLLQLRASRRFEYRKLTLKFACKRPGSSISINQIHIGWKNAHEGDTKNVPIASFSGTLPNHGPRHILYWGIAQEFDWGTGDGSIRNQQGCTVVDIYVRSIFTVHVARFIAHGTEDLGRILMIRESGEFVFTND